MSRVVSNDLFRLIHSLSKQEKRYIKRQASLHSAEANNRYLDLFDAMERQRKPDDTRLLRQLRLSQGRLSGLKNYLYKFVLSSLNSYHKSSVTSELCLALCAIETLHAKGLYEQCGKLVTKTRLLATKYEKFSMVMELIDWEKKLIAPLLLSNPLQLGRQKLMEEQEVIRQLENINGFDQLLNRVKLVNTDYYRVLDKNLLGELEDIVRDPRVKNQLTRSATAADRCHSILSEYNYTMGNPGIAYEHLMSIVGLMEQDPALIRSNPYRYCALLTNGLNLCINSKNYKEHERLWKNLKVFPEKHGIKDQNLINRVAAFSFLHILFRLYSTNEYRKLRQLIPAHEPKLWRFEKEVGLNLYMSIHFMIFHLYFMYMNYKKALRYLNTVIAYERTGVRSDIIGMAKIASLVVHYELGNTDLLPYLIRSTYRYLYRAERLYGLEKAILVFIRKKMPAINGPKELIRAFKELKEEILEISKDPYQRKGLEYFDFISWLESKITKKSFAEVISAKEKVYL